MTQQCAFVDPSSLSLPSSSLKRPASPASSTDDSTPCPTDEPPRKRSRSTVTPEERKEARAHRNRIAAQNSRDRRKAQFGHLERRVTELEEENRRLRAGIHVSPSSSISVVSEPDHVTTLEREQEQLRKREEGQRERENQELRERIRTLEKGYEAVVQALAAQGTPSVTSSIPTPPATSPAPICSIAFTIVLTSNIKFRHLQHLVSLNTKYRIFIIGTFLATLTYLFKFDPCRQPSPFGELRFIRFPPEPCSPSK
ncbi:hypothetical protein JVT61DRAFT_13885 [Boletus reticuloceps]|uniref:X-box-binding protein 1 n=1 Tax=Boletus reticuloceps TaxID=495285 RepID=A0A8I2YTN8_9AGAM|nr:hypothetical protein JVT61DRAFT_13885 [Boletus reticuloceps]